MPASFDEGLRADARRARPAACRRSSRCCAGCSHEVRRHAVRTAVAHDGGRPAGTGSWSTPRRWCHVAFGATYGPYAYRELDRGALRSALPATARRCSGWSPRRTTSRADAGDRPSTTARASTPRSACHDYPQLYDMTAPPTQRRRAVRAPRCRREPRRDPGTYAPFTVARVPRSDWEEQDWCLRWPVAPAAATRPDRRVPPGGHYPAVPTLVLSGELDSITTPAEGALVAGAVPARRAGASSPTASTSPPTATPTTAPSRIVRALRARPRPRHHAAGLRRHPRCRRCGRMGVFPTRTVRS